MLELERFELHHFPLYPIIQMRQQQFDTTLFVDTTFQRLESPEPQRQINFTTLYKTMRYNKAIPAPPEAGPLPIVCESI